MKKGLVSLVRDELEEEDLFYLYHPEIVELMEQSGEQVAAIANYESDGYRFQLDYALKQTLYVLETEEDADKKLLLITDRFTSKQKSAVESVAAINRRDDIGCDVWAVAIGGTCDLESLALHVNRLITTPNAAHLGDILREELNVDLEELKER